jgi:hypothetical protein
VLVAAASSAKNSRRDIPSTALLLTARPSAKAYGPHFPDHGIVTPAISHDTPIGVSWSFYLSSFGVCSNNSSRAQLSRSLRVI